MNNRELRQEFDRYFFERIKIDKEYRKAYNYILGLYLGDGHITLVPGTMGLVISCDSKYPNLISKAKEQLEKVFIYNKVYLNDTHKQNCVDVTIHNNHLGKLFPQVGPGKKHDRDVSLKDWQKDNIEYEELLLGLFHSDGSFYESKTKSIYGKIYTRHFYEFSNCSLDIHDIYKNCLENIGVEYKYNLKKRTNRDSYIHGKLITNHTPIYHTIIQKKKEVEKAYKILGYKS